MAPSSTEDGKLIFHPAGKTAPRLLEDLLDYDARWNLKQQYHVLADPAPQFLDQKIFPVRKHEKACRHQLLLKEGQSRGADQNGDFSGPCVVAAFCSRCKYHFQITVDHLKGGTIHRVPCTVSSQIVPLHHFRYVPNKSYRTVPASASKYDGHTELHHFLCSSAKCPTFTEIKITPPRFSKESRKLVVDRAKLEQRFTEAESADSERFANCSPTPPAEALWMLFQYLRDAVGQKADEKKKISKRNRKLLLAFGHDCDGLFNYLDFTQSESGNENGNSGELLEFWNLPCPDGPDGNREQLNFLTDIKFELLELIRERDPERRLPEKSVSALKAIQQSLGCWGYPQLLTQSNPDSVEHPYYASLGACENFTDDLIRYSYFKQKMCDAPNKRYYLDCLIGLAQGRKSTELEMEYAKEESCGEVRHSKILEAYRFFCLDPSMTEEDDYFIGVYRSRVENAPRQKEDASKCLKIIGLARGSSKLVSVADDRSMSLQEAYDFLGVTEETLSDTVEAAAQAKGMDGGDSNQIVKALRVIANFRSDLSLHESATGFERPESDGPDIAQAYKLMQIEDPTTISDANILMYYKSLQEKAMGLGSKESYEKALKTIALARKSNYLLAKLDNPDAIVAPRASTAEHPIGLSNIGNTCYLNSLLQWWFTVNIIRDIAMNFQDYRLDVEEDHEDLFKVVKQVSNESATLNEIINAQTLVEELGILFSNLKTASTDHVEPSRRLAVLALLSKDSFMRWKDDSSSPTTQALVKNPPHTVRIEDPDFGMQPLPPPETHPTPSPPRYVARFVDTVMTDRPETTVYPTIEEDDTSSEATLVNSDEVQAPNVNGDVDVPMEDHPRESEGKGKGKELVVSPQRYPTPEPEIIDGLDPSVNEATGKGSDEPPPYPPRNKHGPIDTASANTSPKDAKQNLKFGAQNDVSEALDNIFYRLQCAIRPSAVDERGNEVSQITDLFFGAANIWNNKKGRVEFNQTDIFQYLKAFPASTPNTTRNIYEALDAYFDPQWVDLNGGKVLQHSCVEKLPPILQIMIPRADFNKTTGAITKNQNWVTANPTIYLDRYLEAEDDSPLFARRKDAWEWKESLRELENRRRVLSEPHSSLNVPESHPVSSLDLPKVLGTTAEALKAIQEADIEGVTINPELLDGLEQRGEETATELETKDRQIEGLRKTLNDQFADMRKHKYSLQAVFMHRGTALGGHYWIYIYDFVKEIWRECNDEHVRIVEDTNKIFSPDTSPGNKTTPYLLVYVDDEQKNQLVQAVCRNLHGSSPSEGKSSFGPVPELEDEGIDMNGDAGGFSTHVENAS